MELNKHFQTRALVFAKKMANFLSCPVISDRSVSATWNNPGELRSTLVIWRVGGQGFVFTWLGCPTWERWTWLTIRKSNLAAPVWVALYGRTKVMAVDTSYVTTSNIRYDIFFPQVD